jgi:hypothetical protein
MNTTKMLYTANLIAPDGFTETYSYEAYSKAEARSKIARMYRDDHPASSGLYLPYSAMRLEWVGEPRPITNDEY